MWTLLSLRRSDRVTATSARQARLLNARYATIPDNLDLAILEVAPPKPSGAFKYYRRTLHSPFLDQGSQPGPLAFGQA